MNRVNIFILGVQMEKRKVLAAAAPTAILITIIYTIMLLFNLEFIPLLLVITGLMVVFFAWRKTKPADATKGILRTLAFLTVLHLAWGILGAYAIIGLIVYVIVISVYSVWTQRHIISIAIEELETAIYGRKMEKGEKRPRLKFVWKKKESEE